MFPALVCYNQWDHVRVGNSPKGITDVQLGGASGGTEVTATDRGGSSQIIEDQKANISHIGNKD